MSWRLRQNLAFIYDGESCERVLFCRETITLRILTIWPTLKWPVIA